MEAFDFGKCLIKARNRKGVSQHSLGVKLGVSQARISDLEKCKYIPRNHDLQTIADFLEADIREITPKWWHVDVQASASRAQRAHLSARWWRSFYMVLLLSFAWDVYSELVEHPLKIVLSILVLLVFTLIYHFSVRNGLRETLESGIFTSPKFYKHEGI